MSNTASAIRSTGSCGLMPRNFSITPCASTGWRWIRADRARPRAPPTLVLRGDPRGEPRGIELVQLRVVTSSICAANFVRAGSDNFRVGELRRQHLAFEERRSHDVAQAHLRVERGAGHIVEAALHVHHLRHPHAHAPLRVPRRAEPAAQLVGGVHVGMRAAAAGIRLDGGRVEMKDARRDRA